MRGLKIKGIPQLAEFLGSSKWRKKEMLGHTPFSEVDPRLQPIFKHQ